MSVASALAASLLTTELSATKRVASKDTQGRITESWAPFTKLLPGEEVTYTLACTNHGNLRAADLVVSLPIPAEMTLATPESGSAGAETTYSIDGGKTFASLERLVVTAPDGATRPACREDLNFVRWQANHTPPPRCHRQRRLPRSS